MHEVVLDGRDLDLATVGSVARGEARLALGPHARARIEAAHAVVRRVLEGTEQVYGVNTGFGHLKDIRIPPQDLEALQANLIRSHAAGVGAPLPDDAVRALMLLRTHVLALGHSGVRPIVVESLIAHLNAGVLPVIPEQGSVGASGDLAPLSHLALLLMGEGRARVGGRTLPAAEAQKAAKIAPLTLGPKEGIALINGTQMITALGALAAIEARNLAAHADLAGAASLEALKGSHKAFEARLHDLKPHPGQIESATNLRALLDDSAIARSHAGCGRVQDAYSLRCMPQVHGAAREVIRFVETLLTTEINAVTDNPIVFPESGELVSGGNFHGEAPAMALDALAIAAAEIASIAERRIERLMNPVFSGLPAFLTRSPGVNSGLMMAQVTAAALVSENKILCHPACVDSIPSSAGREDHVSMGAHSAWKLTRVVDNTRRVLA
ncbi:MAG TPA: histidine ammonia-lyase, partial [Candidatus Polarisedimenticolia bacterium]|nr:histidine ammonia-lyase [Candidatus Polarisedimenticolia bacterium]